MALKVVEFDNATAAGLSDVWGINKIWLEIDERGQVLREVGFGKDGSVKHKHPGDGQFGRYGVFDVNIIEPTTPSDISLEQFEEVWDGRR